MSDEKFELISYNGKSFLGISKGDSVFIDFTKMRKNQGFVELMGNKGTKKSSTLKGIAYAMGGELSLDKKRLFNSIDNDLEETLIGKKGDQEYMVEVASSRFTVKKKVGDKWKKDDDDTPENLIKDLCGTVGFFPFHVQALKGRKQIEYFQSAFNLGDTASKKIDKLDAEYDAKFSQRTGINQKVTMLKGSLEAEPLYQNYEKSSKKFEKPINADKEKKKYDDLSVKKTAYEKYQNTVALAEADVKDKTNKIIELEKQLEQLKSERDKMQESVVTGSKWLVDNKGVLKEFETINEEWLGLSKTLADQRTWQDILKKENQYNEEVEKSMTLTGELDELNEKILKATNDCLPKVKGLTAKVATGIDKNGKPEGMFFLVPGKREAQPIHELSETEYADMWCLIWEETGAQFIFIENLPSFGDSMVNILNQFVKNGGTVFYTEMNRQQKELAITFKSKIE